jgi:hypothetical protein
MNFATKMNIDRERERAKGGWLEKEHQPLLGCCGGI